MLTPAMPFANLRRFNQPMQVPVQSQVLQPTAGSQFQTQQGPAFLQQFDEDGMSMSAQNPATQFGAMMMRRGGTPWQFGSHVAYAPQAAQQAPQGAIGTQGMPPISDQQIQLIAQMVARYLGM